jgi:hypothetical protein
MAQSINTMHWIHEVWFTVGAGIFPLPTMPRLVQGPICSVQSELWRSDGVA